MGASRRLKRRGSAAARRARVSLTMIVKDEEAHLPACLGSVRGVFDQVVVVDTGSTDRTVEVARSFGAEVFDFPWCDSFAAARNASLDRATGDYAMWLDADDRIDPAELPRLQRLLASLRADDPACYMARIASAESVVHHLQLFPVRPGVRWRWRAHECPVHPGIPVRPSGLTVLHSGYDDPAAVRRKLERNLRLLMLDLVAEPTVPRHWEEAARTLHGLGDWAGILRLGEPPPTPRGQFWAGAAAMKFGRQAEAEGRFRRVLATAQLPEDRTYLDDARTNLGAIARARGTEDPEGADDGG